MSFKTLISNNVLNAYERYLIEKVIQDIELWTLIYNFIKYKKNL